MAVKKKRKLAISILGLSLVPILFLCIVLTYHIQNAVREGMSYEIEQSLSGTAHFVISMYNIQDGGEFSFHDGHLYKGETDITADYRMLDDIKNDTGIDITIFYGDTRRLTTLTNRDGERIVGTTLSDNVKQHVKNFFRAMWILTVSIILLIMYQFAMTPTRLWERVSPENLLVR